jgi:hypothetical protein
MRIEASIPHFRAAAPSNDPAPIWPDPSGDDSNFNNGNLINPTGDPSTDAQTLANLLYFLYNHPNDIRAQQQLLDFLSKLSSNGEYTNDPNNPIYQVMAKFPPDKMQQLITEMLSTNAILLFFQSGGNVDQVESWISSLENVQGDNPFTEAFKAALSNLAVQVKLYPSEYEQNGQLCITILDPNGNPVTYYWNSNDPVDQAMIQAYLRSKTNDFWSDPDVETGMNGILAFERTNLVNSLLAKGTDIMVIIILLMAGVYDLNYNTQLGGYSSSTKQDTTYSNMIQTLINQFAKVSAGGMSGDDAMSFMKNMQYLATEMGLSFSTGTGDGSVSSQFNSQTYAAFMNTPVTFNGPSGPTTMTLGQVFQNVSTGQPGWTPDMMSAALNSINGSAGGESPSYQALLSALNGGAGLITQQSKTINTLSGIISQLLNTVDNLGSSSSDPNKTGSYSSFIFQIINAFKST